MYIADNLRTELDFFRRTNESQIIRAGKSTCRISDADDRLLYMALSSSLVMDYSEDGFFEDFVITDKAVTGKEEMQIDAYAFIETDSASRKQLHVFQYKLYENGDKAASPIELLHFATFVNNVFVHPEFLDSVPTNPIVKEIKNLCDEFLSGRRGRRITVYCHYINNAKGVTKSNEKQISEVVMGRFLSDRQQFGFSIQVNGVDDILDLATDGKIRVDNETIDIAVDGSTAYRLEDNSSKQGLGLPRRVIVCMCNVNEFIRLQNKYHHNQLYTDNIRLYLGDRGAVNKDIINTITGSESIWFPYMNNGISIICDNLEMGSINTTKGTLSLTLTNMQIINGCQTINALYSAKYGLSTRDNFRPATVLVRIYEIDPKMVDFKMSIIKATNNQNAVKSYSLMANDPIQIRISDFFSRFDIIYDRKGESKYKTDKKLPVISMTSAALAYRAVYLFMARSLRSGLGMSRVFMKGEYERVFDINLLEEGNEEQFVKKCCEILISSYLLDTVRELIPQYAEKYNKQLPIIRKSAYYLAGYVYAFLKKSFDDLRDEMQNDYKTGNWALLKGKNFPQRVRNTVVDSFVRVLDAFIKLYKKTKGVEKTDIDNFLKDKDFEQQYISNIDDLIKTVKS